MVNKEFTKDRILWQSTIVKFRNGKLGLAIRDKISDEDNDGDEVFILYDKEKKMFYDSKRLCCYDENLRNTLSEKGIYRKLNSIINNTSDEVALEDSDWDVVKVAVYAYALDAFKVLTGEKEISWLYQIND